MQVIGAVTNILTKVNGTIVPPNDIFRLGTKANGLVL